MIGYSGVRASLGVLSMLLFVVACGSQNSPREYSNEELALDESVDHYLHGLVPFAQYRTSADEDRDRVDPLGGSGHERERATFEFRLRQVMLGADGSLPPDVAIGSGVLHDARDEALAECAAEAGWPGVELYDVSQELGEQYERELGLTLEMFLDLRHECAKYAANYPTLGPAYRDELLAKRRDHYMTAVRDWMAATPELVVPVEYHEGANKPVEDYWRKACKQADDYEQCLRDVRVEP